MCVVSCRRRPSIFIIGLIDDLKVSSLGTSSSGRSSPVGLHIWLASTCPGFGGYHLVRWWSVPLTILWLIALHQRDQSH